MTCYCCGSKESRPRSTGQALEDLTRANRLRLEGEFNEAEKAYQQVLISTPDEHEALWGRLLSRYGVELLREARTGRTYPLCHFIRRKPMRETGDFQEACKNAPPEIRASYEQMAAYVDNAQQEVLQLAAQQTAYDIFLCYKETEMDSANRTEDSVKAYELYTELTREGWRVFYAPEATTGIMGSNYEALIYQALSTSRVMIVLGLKPEHFEATWVHSEWSRYLEMMDEGADKLLIPLYRDFDAYQLPREFLHRRIQAYDMGKMAFLVDLKSTLRKILLPENEDGKTAAPTNRADTVPGRRGAGIEQKAVKKKRPVEEKKRPNKVSRQESTSQDLYEMQETEDGQGVVLTAFNDRDFVGHLVLPPEITEIDREVFKDCEYITEVTLPRNLRKIGAEAFAGCASLKKLVLPPLIRIIGVRAFAGCTALKMVKLPVSINEMGKGAFQGCGQLKISSRNGNVAYSLVNTPGVGTIATVTGGLKEEKKVKIPYKINGAVVTRIAPGAFKGDRTLGRVCIPRGVSKIEKEAFAGCCNLALADFRCGKVDIAQDAFTVAPNLVFYVGTIFSDPRAFATERGVACKTNPLYGVWAVLVLLIFLLIELTQKN